MKTSATSSIEDLTLEYHKLYAKYKRPEYREILANLAKCTPYSTEDWETKVNEGCDRQGLPRRYTQET